MRDVRIHIIGGDQWALGVEYYLARKCLSAFATLVDDPKDADFIHTIDVENTAQQIFRGEFKPCRPIVGAINNHPSRLVEWPGFVDVSRKFMYLVPQTVIAAKDMDRLGLPYPGKTRIITDCESYYPIVKNDERLEKLRNQLNIPPGTYLIGLLQRDSEGRDLTVAKRQKGPDIFLALMILLKKQLAEKTGFHVLLGGPRRHWIRERLERFEIPYSFMGREITGDDYPGNILDKQTMCLLYNLLDLYVIPTRWEGAPRQIFDVLECRKKIISTPVGIVPEILSPECLFDSLEQGVELIERDIRFNYLQQFVEIGCDKIKSKHVIPAVGKLWEKVYGQIVKQEKSKPLVVKNDSRSFGNAKHLERLVRRVWTFSNHALAIEDTYRRWNPHRVTLYTENVAGRRALERLSEDLRAQQIETSWNADYGKTILVWGVVGLTRLSVSPSRKIVLILDDASCIKLLSANDEEKQILQHFLDAAATTIIADHELLGQLMIAGIRLVNPLVVDIWWYLLDDELGRKKRIIEKCLVVIDTREESLCSVDVLLKQIPDCSLLIDLGSDPWLQGDMGHWQEMFGDYALAIILTPNLDKMLIRAFMVAHIVCVYPYQFDRLKVMLSFFGIGFDASQMLDGIVGKAIDDYVLYSQILSLPYREDAVKTLAQIVYQPQAAESVRRAL